MTSAMIYLAAADMMFRRCAEISAGNIVLHGLSEIEDCWRHFRPARVGPEAEGIVAAWWDDCGFGREERNQCCALLVTADHRWNRRDNLVFSGEG